MSDIAIRVDRLGKKYHLGELQRYKTFRESLVSAAGRPFRAVKSLMQSNGHHKGNGDLTTLWALRDLSFDVKIGEVVGIIGRNGAGKSTLLKVLSRITDPTDGSVQIYGRVGSLLEVGTGFHPELTGRENIYLAGAILGMKRVEINRKFDEIVAFSEIEKFLDTPSKRYSSGMYMRLAFAVAAHLDPEVLLVDEVLAVGDTQFQKKCLGKMSDVAKEGRTVLFVSHNMPAVMNLCSRGIVLNGGTLAFDSDVKGAVEEYLKYVEGSTRVDLSERMDRKGNQRVKFLAYEIRDEKGTRITCAYSGQTIQLALRYEVSPGADPRNVHVSVDILGRFDEHLFHLATSTPGADFEGIPSSGEVVCTIPHLPLQPGRYPFNVFCQVNSELSDFVRAAGFLEVESGDYFNTGRLPSPNLGTFLVDHDWSVLPQ